MKKTFLIFVFLFFTHLAWAKVINLMHSKKPFFRFAGQIDLSYSSVLGYYKDYMSSAPYVNLSVFYNPKIFNYWLFFAELGYAFSNVTEQEEKFSYLPVGLGTSYEIPVYRDLSIGFKLSAGFYFMNLDGENYRNFYGKGGISLFYQFTDHLKSGLNFEFLYLHDEYGGPKSINIGAGFGYAFGTPLKEKDIKILSFEAEEIFAALYPTYYHKNIGALQLKNTSRSMIKDIEVSFYIKKYMNQKTRGKKQITLLPQKKALIPVYAYFNEDLKDLKGDFYTTGIIELKYEKNGKQYLKRELVKLQIFNKNALVWNDLNKLGSFIHKKEPVIMSFSRKALSLSFSGLSEVSKELLQILKIFESLRAYHIKYVKDPASYRNLLKGKVDYIQYPQETLSVKTGDCDDLTVLLASLFESVGLSTAFVSIPGHIFLMVEVKNLPQSESLISYQKRTWIPIEATALSKGFVFAWQKGAENYRGAPRREITTVNRAVKQYAPLSFKTVTNTYSIPEKRAKKFILEEFKKVKKLLLAQSSKENKKLSAPGLVRKAIKYCKSGMLSKGIEIFQKAITVYPKYAYGYYNLIFAYQMTKKYQKAIEVFKQFQKIKKDDPKALIMISKVYFAMEKYKESKTFYERAVKLNPEMENKTYQKNLDTKKGTKASIFVDDEWIEP